MNHVRFLRAALGSAAVSVRGSPAPCLPDEDCTLLSHAPHRACVSILASYHTAPSAALTCKYSVRLQMPRINIGTAFASAANAAFNMTLPAPFNPCVVATSLQAPPWNTHRGSCSTAGLLRSLLGCC